MTQADKKQTLAFAICDFLSSNIPTAKPEAAEGIEVAIQCISDAFGIDVSDPQQQKLHSIKPANLLNIFDVFLSTQKKMASNPSPSTNDPVQDKAKAEEYKAQGNKEMAAKNYTEAISLYSLAIEKDPSNPVFYGNRAAAYSQIAEHEKALQDASKSLEIDPNYHKGHSRLGHAYFCLGKFQESVESYKKALAADPNNQSLKTSLAAAESKLSGPNVPSIPNAGDRDPLGGAGPGGMDFASMMNNPGFMDMASSMMNDPSFASMMQNPQVAQMAQNLMKNPDALKGLMSNPEIAKMASNMMKK